MKKTGMASAATVIALNGFKVEVLASTSTTGQTPPTPIPPPIPPPPPKKRKQRKIPPGATGTPQQLWDNGTDEVEVDPPTPPENPPPTPGSLSIESTGPIIGTGPFTLPAGGTITQIPK